MSRKPWPDRPIDQKDRTVAAKRRYPILKPVARCLMPAASRHGFTLLELIVVISLISLTLGLSAVYLAGTLPRARLEAAARELSASIGHARAQARITGETKRIILDLDGRNFGLEGRSPRRLPDSAGMKVIDPDMGEVLQGRYALAVRPGGLVEGGRIVLTSGRRTITVDIDPIVGSVLIRQ